VVLASVGGASPRGVFFCGRARGQQSACWAGRQRPRPTRVQTFLAKFHQRGTPRNGHRGWAGRRLRGPCANPDRPVIQTAKPRPGRAAGLRAGPCLGRPITIVGLVGPMVFLHAVGRLAPEVVCRWLAGWALARATRAGPGNPGVHRNKGPQRFRSRRGPRADCCFLPTN